jgi:hypothetical protein
MKSQVFGCPDKEGLNNRPSFARFRERPEPAFAPCVRSTSQSVTHVLAQKRYLCPDCTVAYPAPCPQSLMKSRKRRESHESTGRKRDKPHNRGTEPHHMPDVARSRRRWAGGGPPPITDFLRGESSKAGDRYAGWWSVVPATFHEENETSDDRCREKYCDEDSQRYSCPIFRTYACALRSMCALVPRQLEVV